MLDSEVEATRSVMEEALEELDDASDDMDELEAYRCDLDEPGSGTSGTVKYLRGKGYVRLVCFKALN